MGTLQGTNISLKNGILKMIFPFPKVGYVNSLEGIKNTSFGRSSALTCRIAVAGCSFPEVGQEFLLFRGGGGDLFFVFFLGGDIREIHHV